MKWTDQILNSRARLAIPVMTHPGIEAIGKTVREAVTDGQVHYEAIKYQAENFNIAACTAMMDLTVEAEAFGAEVQLPENEIPTVVGRLVSDEESVRALVVPDMNAGRIPEFLKANRLAVENIRDKPVLSGCIGPYSLAGRLYDMSEIMVGIYIDPDTVNLLLEKCTQFLIEYCRNLKATGATGVVLAEPAAGLLSNDDCMEFSTKYVKQIVEAVQDDSFTIILHNCGNSGQCTDAMVASGARALHFGNKIDMLEALKGCPQDIVVMGNLDPVSVFKQAKVEDVEKKTAELLEKTREYKNFVISSGCDLPPHVPAANLQAFFAVLEKYNS